MVDEMITYFWDVVLGNGSLECGSWIMVFKTTVLKVQKTSFPTVLSVSQRYSSGIIPMASQHLIICLPRTGNAEPTGRLFDRLECNFSPIYYSSNVQLQHSLSGVLFPGAGVPGLDLVGYNPLSWRKAYIKCIKAELKHCKSQFSGEGIAQLYLPK